MRAVVVTGTSSGIGRATARALMKAGFNVYGSVRKPADGEALSQEWGAQFRPLLFDVQDQDAVLAAAAQVREELRGETLAGLVLNAGVAVMGPLLNLTAPELRRQLDVNVTAQILVTQAFAPQLGTDPGLSGGPGRVVGISSVAGRLVFPFMGIYAASKHALEAVLRSLRMELVPFGIAVVAIGPGAVVTPIWGKGDTAVFEANGYGAMLPGFLKATGKAAAGGDPPERIAAVVLEALTAVRPRHRYAPVAGKFANWTLPKLLPDSWVDALLGKVLGFKRR